MKKNALVVGLGKSGLAAVKLALFQNYRVAVYDENSQKMNAFCAEHPEVVPWEKSFRPEFAILSPGISLKKAFVQALQEEAIPLKAEVEFGLEALKLPSIGVTGSNGKSTVVSLCASLLQKAGISAVACGNFGLPVCEIALWKKHPQLLVVELSSYQLELLKIPFFQQACVLNIVENHLDRHGDMETYARCKLRLASLLCGQASPLWIHHTIESTFEKEIKTINYQTFGKGKPPYASGMFSQSAVQRGNLEIAWLLTNPYGVLPLHVKQVAKEFSPLPHRLQKIAEWREIKVFNDSKSTNPSATVAALESFSSPVVWIAGGSSEKRSDFSLLYPLVKEKVAHIVAIGEEKKRIASFFSSLCPVHQKDSFEDAVFHAFSLAKRGDCVLLSPACASFDMFENYQNRGEKFEELVRQWLERRK